VLSSVASTLRLSRRPRRRDATRKEGRVSTVRAEVTFLGALAGRWTRLAAIGVGSLGVAELFAMRPSYAIPCLLMALVLVRRRGSDPRRD
jgi:hypothetical protein